MTRRRTPVDGQLALPLGPVLTDDHRTAIAGYVEQGWQHRAACRGREDDLFFPDDGAAETWRNEAVKVCRDCPVLESCRAAGILGDEFGIWGAVTRDERRVIAEQIACGAPPSRVLHRSHRVGATHAHDEDSAEEVAA